MTGPDFTMKRERRRARDLRGNMRASLVDGSLYAFMVGSAEKYLVPFGLALGLSQEVAGLLEPVPQFAGAVIGLSLPAVIARVGSAKAVTVSLVTAQGVALLALGLLAVLAAMQPTERSAIPAWAVFALSGLYWTAGLAAAPTWTVWASSMFPRAMRSKFFSVRSRLHNVLVVAGLACAGLMLGDPADGSTREFGAFAALLWIAGLVRVASAVALAVQTEPVPVPVGHRDVTWRELFSGFRHEAGGRALAYMLAFSFASGLAVPFFTPYLKAELGFSYMSFTVLITVFFLSGSAVLPALGGFAKRHGADRLLWVFAIGTLPLPLLWLVSPNYWWLLGVHVIAGAAWAGIELAKFLLLFDAIPASTRVGALARFNILDMAAKFVGAAVGAVVLREGWLGGYAALFILSTILRGVALPLALRVRLRDESDTSA